MRLRQVIEVPSIIQNITFCIIASARSPFLLSYALKKAMKKLQDCVYDIFLLLPSDMNYEHRLSQIYELLKYATEKEKNVFCLYYEQKLPVKEIASLLDKDKSTISRQLSAFRSRVRLRYLYLTK